MNSLNRTHWICVELLLLTTSFAGLASAATPNTPSEPPPEPNLADISVETSVGLQFTPKNEAVFDISIDSETADDEFAEEPDIHNLIAPAQNDSPDLPVVNQSAANDTAVSEAATAFGTVASESTKENDTHNLTGAPTHNFSVEPSVASQLTSNHEPVSEGFEKSEETTKKTAAKTDISDLTAPIAANVSVGMSALPPFTSAVRNTAVTSPVTAANNSREFDTHNRLLARTLPNQSSAVLTCPATANMTGETLSADSTELNPADSDNCNIRLAQTVPPRDIQRTPPEPIPEPAPLPENLPSLEDLLGPESVPPAVEPDAVPDGETIIVSRFDVTGSTVFSEAEFARITADFINRPITFAEVLEVRSAITQLYIDEGYVTSGAFVPPQSFEEGGVAEIEVIEGSVADIEITGTRRLHPGYVGSRIGLGTSTPLNIDKLLARLQLLQIDPLIENISADLQAGIDSGTNLLVVDVTEANSFDLGYALDNNRSPSVGTVRNQVRLTEANLLGLGDRISLGYNFTSGSDSFDTDYTIPLSPYGTTLRFSASLNSNEVIEEPFNVLEIASESDAYDLTLRHPLIQTPAQEFALGLTASHQRSQTFLGIDDIGPFPLSVGADDEGRTRVSAVRFFQDWTQRSSEQVIALRSQFSLGVNALGATINESGPDSRFFSWQGQGQWVRSLGSDRLLVVNGAVQLATDSLLSLEQFGLGGQSTVRGYRQDQLLTDNGVLASVEARLPVLRDGSNRPLLQVAPFFDIGHGWNNGGEDPDPNTLVGIGAGLLLNYEDRLTARLDYGIPLTAVDADRNSLQENGFYFTLGVSLF
ncbi:MAG: ShlB/FhaC/HecB family hemolysin secretion/activation protein [Leptolyngbya sp. SIOISBB]|nr:ShlB/FhaC/HecB family hemolysin secretion/activation protein [Leptolyngbya sp. SIOISBB]